MNNSTIRKVLFALASFALFAWLFLALAHPNVAFDQDLARHLAIGKMIWTTRAVPTTNLFTFTNPGFPFLDHHWLSEVVFYLIDISFGALFLTFMKIALILGALAFVLATAVRRAGFPAAIVAAAVFLPLFFERTDERPEMFGYFFLAVLIYLFFSGNPQAKRWLWVVPLIMALWVNMHISFVYGALVIAAYVASELWRTRSARRPWRAYLPSLSLGIASAAALFINPRGAAGAFYPFTIFSNYGYRIIENQNIFFLLPRIHDPVLFYFSYCLLPLIAAFLLFLGLRALLRRSALPRLDPNAYALLSVFLVSTGLAIWAIRNFPNAALAGIPAGAFLLMAAFPRAFAEPTDFRRFSRATGAVFAATIAALIGCFSLTVTRPPALGVQEDYKAGVDFFLAAHLPGNIFNDFDIGGYLDGRLYPAYRTFVDNRPEAFPADFFKTYIAIQEDPAVRAKEFAKYDIRSIIFSVNDITPWAQEFLREITNDPAWKTVYLDNFTIVLTKA